MIYKMQISKAMQRFSRTFQGLTGLLEYLLFCNKNLQQNLSVYLSQQANSQLMRRPNTFKQSISSDVPDFLDWSKSNPHCVDVIRDMKNCGTSQVFASTSVLSDLNQIRTGFNILSSLQQIAIRTETGAVRLGLGPLYSRVLN
ncbi:Cathepsin_B [Hexamita inflata]|uniref:Cathepsin B n=1 Tax=Hexamita inflata TaxID=28002 RepID=A0AA86RAQ4_9EUKA|nr:Cathepsin B [Hexamita inflata]